MIKLLRIASLINMVTAMCLCGGCTTEPHCPEVVTYKRNLSDAEKKLLKYTEQDTITFITNTGDTNILVVDSIYDSYNEYEGSGNDPSCPQPINAYEVQKIITTNLKGELNFGVNFHCYLELKTNVANGSLCLETKFNNIRFYHNQWWFNDPTYGHYLSNKTFFNNTKYSDITFVFIQRADLKNDTVFYDNTYKVIGARIGNIEYVIVE